ncbi:hypothetical protein [Salinactinospora qingdaonensis]|uniref:Universal stress protein family protein n=1 Tax=Salinactinospora qingdaonensis TaxID=702744 RepID=A0ABP7FVN3_9ACTN
MLRGQRRLSAVLLDSTGMELAVTDRCPVVVVPDRAPNRRRGGSSSGLDGSASARLAAAWAFAAAAERGTEVRAATAHGHFSQRRSRGV